MPYDVLTVADVNPECRLDLGRGWQKSSLTSANLYRQRRILRPLSHRSVIEGKVLVAEQIQQEQIDSGRDATSAVGHHALFPGDTLRGEPLFCVRERHKSLGLRIKQRRRRHIATAGNAPRPAVPTRLQALVELRAECIDDNGVPIILG